MKIAEVHAALEVVRQGGPLTASRVVEAALDPESPLHDMFQWDDSLAAHEFRLGQARHLIVSVTIKPAGAMKLTAYVHVPARIGEGEYVPIDSIVRQPHQLELARLAVLQSIRSAQANLVELEEAQRIFGGNSRRTARARRALVTAQEEVAASI